MPMSSEMKSAPREDRIAAMVLQYEVERFYYDEAALLDSHRYEEWLALFADDAHYFMPIRRTRMQRELDKEFTKPGEMAFFDDTKMLLDGRIKKLESGRSWAEDPPSRTRHLITNVRILKDDGRTFEVESNFHLYRTRSIPKRPRGSVRGATCCAEWKDVSRSSTARFSSNRPCCCRAT
jgi:3-phenylpropionate/cinnamic acid dioxygenase small subunit